MQADQSLSNIIAELSKKVDKVETTCRQFFLLNAEYAKRIQECKYPSKYALEYVKNWFQSFLAFRDEVMVLVQGAVYRSYHVQEHSCYSHERSAIGNLSGCEARFYVAYKLLSKCSVDGIKYLGHHSTSKGLRNILDSNDQLSSKLYALDKSMYLEFEQSATQILKLVKAKEIRVVVKSYRSESIAAHWLLRSDSQEEAVLAISRASIPMTGGRSLSLRTTVDDIVEEDDFVQSNQKSRTAMSRGNLINDDEDFSTGNSVAEDDQRLNPFVAADHEDESLDTIKRQLGASESLLSNFYAVKKQRKDEAELKDLQEFTAAIVSGSALPLDDGASSTKAALEPESADNTKSYSLSGYKYGIPDPLLIRLNVELVDIISASTYSSCGIGNSSKLPQLVIETPVLSYEYGSQGNLTLLLGVSSVLRAMSEVFVQDARKKYTAFGFPIVAFSAPKQFSVIIDGFPEVYFSNDGVCKIPILKTRCSSRVKPTLDCNQPKVAAVVDSGVVIRVHCQQLRLTGKILEFDKATPVSRQRFCFLYSSLLFSENTTISSKQVEQWQQCGIINQLLDCCRKWLELIPSDEYGLDGMNTLPCLDIDLRKFGNICKDALDLLRCTIVAIVTLLERIYAGREKCNLPININLSDNRMSIAAFNELFNYFNANLTPNSKVFVEINRLSLDSCDILQFRDLLRPTAHKPQTLSLQVAVYSLSIRGVCVSPSCLFEVLSVCSQLSILDLSYSIAREPEADEVVTVLEEVMKLRRSSKEPSVDFIRIIVKGWQSLFPVQTQRLLETTSQLMPSCFLDSAGSCRKL